ncbi:MAG: hypothetical protein QOF84_4959 [Streptomyces sp.]|nr:hypothetical protein [Streptomyces sp.]MDX6350169.1 hypothetical protein [Streptomyces sp.]
MRTRVRLWRWRRNPLRRRSDVLETWVALIAAIVIALGAPAAGWATGSLVNGALQHTVRAQRSERSVVPALVLKAGPREIAQTDPDSGQVRQERRSAVARWTAPDGTKVTGPVHIPVSMGKGDTVRIWTDRQGRVMPAPLDPAAAATHAVLAGMGAFVAASVLLMMGRYMLLWQLMRRRLADWEREWEAAGQDWGRAGRA